MKREPSEREEGRYSSMVGDPSRVTKEESYEAAVDMDSGMDDDPMMGCDDFGGDDLDDVEAIQALSNVETNPDEKPSVKVKVETSENVLSHKKQQKFLMTLPGRQF